jgi:hypothetical protein
MGPPRGCAMSPIKRPFQRWFQVTGVSGFATETRAKDAMLSLACLAAALPASLCNGLIGRTPAKAHRPRAAMGILWGALAGFMSTLIQVGAPGVFVILIYPPYSKYEKKVKDLEMSAQIVLSAMLF